MISITISDILKGAEKKLKQAGIENFRAEARQLLMYILKTDAAKLITDDQKTLSQEHFDNYQKVIFKRCQKVPLQQIISSQEFFGLEFKITPHVFIPRPETELLVEEAIGILKGRGRGKGREFANIIDVGTGCGCIAIALAKNVLDIKIFATDISEQALEIAKENAKAHHVLEKITFLQGDLFAPFEQYRNLTRGVITNKMRDPKENADLIVSNLPYIATSQIRNLQEEVKSFEPLLALDGAEEGLAFIKRLIEEAPNFLKSAGVLILEIGFDQSEKVKELLEKNGHYKDVEFKLDYSGIKRITIAKACSEKSLRGPRRYTSGDEAISRDCLAHQTSRVRSQ